jgi:NADPH:quinone reductase-like Zn-dependent oxidoreductase
LNVRAYGVERFGCAPAVLDLHTPTAADGYVVRMTYAGVNPIDYKLLDSLTPQSAYPFVLGIDFARVLEYVRRPHGTPVWFSQPARVRSLPRVGERAGAALPKWGS